MTHINQEMLNFKDLYKIVSGSFAIRDGDANQDEQFVFLSNLLHHNPKSAD